jgi:hypothetical protein
VCLTKPWHPYPALSLHRLRGYACQYLFQGAFCRFIAVDHQIYKLGSDACYSAFCGEKRTNQAYHRFRAGPKDFIQSFIEALRVFYKNFIGVFSKLLLQIEFYSLKEFAKVRVSEE